MTKRPTRPRPVIVDWSAISPFGIGREAFLAGMSSGGATDCVPAEDGAIPRTRARMAGQFETRTALGRKGTRSMDRLTALTVATAGQLVERCADLTGSPGQDGGAPADVLPGRALVLGTTTGSAQSMMDFTRSSLTGDRPYHVDPARFPNTVMNCAAGQAAIWHRLKGPNVTVGGGRAAGLLALNYARRLQATGRASSVLCGAAEEYSPARAWLQHHTGDAGGADSVLGEGCAMLRVEPSEQAPDSAFADVLALEFGVFDGVNQVAAVLRQCLHTALGNADVTPAELWRVATSGAPGALGSGEHAALDALLADSAADRVSCADFLGDTAAVAAAFQVVSVLAMAETEPADAPRTALITSVDRDGVAGCAVLSLRPTPSGGYGPSTPPIAATTQQ
ncbi:beta-ketoacyl synthase N-terminal-like domain-containing protein [Streptomyces gobiensis]|uniref:beta-ketoacyl synthase N-terminal-like domain-containing protein n=1 Tax=Streptomyces gobiensis TaxID=2875706 RepID=UPI001E5690B1|nr:beta-ketoacyl synthase N-terminal-like domain-containing protein [Streptomyces gobiensis]UGY94206.1 3-oxoacyl-ACP synthase [Streptomyces gobiensis]